MYRHFWRTKYIRIDVRTGQRVFPCAQAYTNRVTLLFTVNDIETVHLRHQTHPQVTTFGLLKVPSITFEKPTTDPECHPTKD